MGKPIIDTSSVTRVGLDLAKRVLRIHAVDATGSVGALRESRARRNLLTIKRAYVSYGTNGRELHDVINLI